MMGNAVMMGNAAGMAPKVAMAVVMGIMEVVVVGMPLEVGTVGGDGWMSRVGSDLCKNWGMRSARAVDAEEDGLHRKVMRRPTPPRIPPRSVPNSDLVGHPWPRRGSSAPAVRGTYCEQ